MAAETTTVDSARVARLVAALAETRDASHIDRDLVAVDRAVLIEAALVIGDLVGLVPSPAQAVMPECGDLADALPGSIRPLGVNSESCLVLTVDLPLSANQMDQIRRSAEPLREQLGARVVVALERGISLGHIGCTRCAMRSDVDGCYAPSPGG